MIALWVTLVAASPVGGVSTPTDDVTVVERFLDGDLVTLRRATVLRAAAGERVDVGLLALLNDYARLVRCRPIDPLPADEREPYRTVRKLVRLERVRLERLVRDRAHRGSTLVHLLGPERLYQLAEAEDRRVIRWPIEAETWPGEILAPTSAEPDCPSIAGGKKERPEAVHREHRRLRINAERSGVADLLDHFDQLPDRTASRVALTYLADAEGVAGFAINARWRRVLEATVARSPDDVRPAARLLLAKIAERSNDGAEVERLYRALLADPARSAAQDSRARVRLVKRLEPQWTAILDVIRGAEKIRPEDEPVLINAEARALYSLGETEQLMTLGRRLVQREDLWRGASDGQLGPFILQTNELLTLLALDLSPSRAIAWLDEIAIAGDEARSERLEQLAERARERRDFDLAVALYDRRRAEVLEGLTRRGPRAAAKDAELIGRRAYIEYDREDVEAFAGFVDALVALATTEQGRPIARYAPHKAIARLTQDLLGRLTDDVKDDPEREKFAAVLLDAGTKLTVQPSRYRRVLERFQPDLIRLAGKWAEGRVAKPDAKKTKRKKAKPVKQLGQVVVQRLPPSLEAPDHATPVPAVATFLMYPTPEGAWREGAPWMSLVPKKKKSR